MLQTFTSTHLNRYPPAGSPNKTQQRLRIITATSLFDGHDAAINIMRRIMQSQGVEVIHLGHNRSVTEIVHAAIQEDVDAIAISSYQGGHMEFYRYLIDQLKVHNVADIKVFGGGGGVILDHEIQQLQAYGVTHIYSPEEGQTLGLVNIINDLIRQCTPRSTSLTASTAKQNIATLSQLSPQNDLLTLAKTLTQLENGLLHKGLIKQLQQTAQAKRVKSVILGVTGTGGAGKSSLTDELVQRFRLDYQDHLKIAIIAVDPSRKKKQGALLGDRIRMNSIDTAHVFMRSMATRESTNEIPNALPGFIHAFISYDYDLIIIETPGIGQGDTGIVTLVDTCLYVMTSEYGAGTQLEKLNILDFADLVAINKFERKGSEDALREVQKQIQRNREQFNQSIESMPVFGTNAAQMNDAGLNKLYRHLYDLLVKQGLARHDNPMSDSKVQTSPPLIEEKRQRYLGEIASSIREYHHQAEQQSQAVRDLQYYTFTRSHLPGQNTPALDKLINNTQQLINPDSNQLLSSWYKALEYEHPPPVNSRVTDLPEPSFKTLSGLNIPKVALPEYHDRGDLLTWLMLENRPGYFPYTAGVYKFKRKNEEPTRMFAGEGDAFRTNRRFKYLASQSPANRLSTAFDSVTLYGCDPDERQDIFGKIGNAGVSIATLDDMQVLYDGFDLCDAKTSVSMTINGPAPILLAQFFNTAITQQIEQFTTEHKRKPSNTECHHIKQYTLQTLRGTVQADILKEDQGQNTCLFATAFSLKMMGDIQQYFIEQKIQHFYSISISGYHIAEAGANPITQLAFTLANGFTYLEAFLARGMQINDFAHRLSFFFSSGMDPEYTVLGRVARRIWAVALREYYQGDERCQKLKYHIQTSGRSLHAQAMDYNEIRTTLQALIAIYDNCNSLHTNAKDEALTTPSEQSVSNALAIQMIINKEWGLAKNENPIQGAFIINQLTDLVEAAVLNEFDRLCLRGGVLGAMETGYQRSMIQEQSMRYETAKHDGSLAIIGVNIAQSLSVESSVEKLEIARSSTQEKQNQILRLKKFKQKHQQHANTALEKLKQVAVNNENIFAELMETVQVCSLGQITQALFEVGGQYRRNM